ncbi:MAG TPA: hypothetical protein QKA14_01565 [Candidatus Megaira endosymbiont of Hartmannula sinica]|nr:hypothetical protein [Candidatus Megaera endosymbiont of Hartmannula sinica]
MVEVVWSQRASNFSNISNNLFIRNPINKDMDYMRPTIIPCFLNKISSNINKSFTDLNFFEIGPVFSSYDNKDDSKPDSIIEEKTVISGVRTGDYISRNIHSQARKVNIFDIKADVIDIISSSFPILKKSFNISGVNSCGDRGDIADNSNYFTKGELVCKFNQDKNSFPSYLHPSRSASIEITYKEKKKEDKKISCAGYIGYIHPKILNLYKIKQDVLTFEIFISDIKQFLDNIENINQSSKNHKNSFSFNKYPKSKRDYAFIINNNIVINDIIEKIKNNINKNVIKNIDIFDIYKGDKLDENYKDKQSIAFSVTMQSNEKTLSNIDIQDIDKKIISLIQENFGGILRDGNK